MRCPHCGDDMELVSREPDEPSGSILQSGAPVTRCALPILYWIWQWLCGCGHRAEERVKEE